MREYLCTSPLSEPSSLESRASIESVVWCIDNSLKLSESSTDTDEVAGTKGILRDSTKEVDAATATHFYRRRPRALQRNVQATPRDKTGYQVHSVSRGAEPITMARWGNPALCIFPWLAQRL